MTAASRPPVEKSQIARMTRWLAIGLAILFLGTAFSLVVFVNSRFQHLDRQPIQGVVYAGTQLRIELMAFRFRLMQTLLTGDDADRQATMEAYDILLSRLSTIESRSGLRLPSNDQKLIDKYREVSAEIRSWEPSVAAIAAGDASSGQRVMERINENAIEFALLSTLTNDYAYVWFIRNADSLEMFFLALGVLTLVSVAIMAVLLRYLFSSARAAENAYLELRAAHQELSEAKRTAESSDRVKSQFLANVSHELRTPLNAIIGFSEILIDKSFGVVTEAKQKEYLGYVLSSGQHLLSLINDILDFSKIQQGHWDPDFAPLDLRAELSEIVRTMAAIASNRNVRFRERFDVEIPIIETDARAFRQILLNVLSNAVKFSPPEGTVEVEMRATGLGEVIVEIDDEGPGIEDDFLKQVGTPFSQARSAALSGEVGTGLGLAITKELLARISGSFAIANRPEGGARATLTFRSGPPL